MAKMWHKYAGEIHYVLSTATNDTEMKAAIHEICDKIEATAEERIAALEAERDRLRAALTECNEAALRGAYNAAIGEIGDALDEYGLILSLSDATPVPTPDARREADGEQPS